MQVQVHARFEIKQVPSIEAVEMQYANTFHVLVDDEFGDVLDLIKDRVYQHAMAYQALSVRIREIQITITDP